MQHIPPDRIEAHLKSLGGSNTVTKGTFEIPATCEVSDLDWNQMDQDHRPWIHRTYTEALRISTDKDSQMSLTRLRLLGLPFFILVTDLKIAPSVYYQGFTLFNMIYVHVVIRCLPGLHHADWYVVSHPLFKPLHWLFHRRFQKIHKVQNDEDVPMRDRRAELRKLGFTFVYENPDFLTANTKTNNVKFPKLRAPVRLNLSGIEQGQLSMLRAEPHRLLARNDGNGRYLIWNEVCPHEGGPLSQGKVCGDEIQCPWHGLKFGGVKLSGENPRATLGDLKLSLDTKTLELLVES